MKLLLVLILLASMAWAADGGDVYSKNCLACHQKNAVGIPGAFPPLAGHVSEILAAKDGRKYIISVALYGLQGSITVKGKTYNGIMPSFGQLKDDEVAAVLNYLASLEKIASFKPFTADEIKAERTVKLTPQLVYEIRKKLGLK